MSRAVQVDGHTGRTQLRTRGQWSKWALPWLSLVALASLIYQHGFPGHEGAHWWSNGLVWATLLVSAYQRRVRCACDDQRRLVEGGLIALAVLALVAATTHATPRSPFVAHALAFVVLGVNLARFSRDAAVRARLHLRPPLLFSLSYLVLVSIGACALALPEMTTHGAGLGLSDALFTSISANCVTGLTIFDIGATLSFKGQVALMTMIQLGGLNVIAFATYFLLYRRGRPDAPDHAASVEFLHTEVDGNLQRVLVRTTALCLAIETTGALLMYLNAGGALSPFSAVFHSVSAFNNAGFGLQQDSLAGLPASTQMITAGLITLGGLGIPILTAVGLTIMRRTPLSIDARVGLAGSAVLLFAGAAILSALAPGHGDESWFYAVSARTAGFSISDLRTSSDATRVALMGLMFIGACSGSTGGGIKISTLAVCLARASARVRGQREARIFGTELTQADGRRAVAVIVGAFVIIGLTGGALALTEPSLTWSDALFEATSAFGTVGLSTIPTEELGSTARVFVAATMLVGRVGPLAVAMSFGGLGRHASRPGLMVG